MNTTAFDRYLARDSAVHRLDARVKVVATLAFIVSVALLPDGAWAVYALAFGLVMAATLAARLSPWRVIKRSLIGLPFLLVAVTVIFSVPGNPIWHGPFGLVASDTGLARFVSIVLRSLISLQAAVLMTMTTRFPDILHALRHLKVPAILVSIIAFMYRYLAVLVEEVQRMLRARASRSAAALASKAGGSIVWRATVTGHMAGQLLVRSLDRSDRVYNAMLSRGYAGELLTLRPHSMRRSDWLALFLALACVAGLQVLAR